MYMHVLYISISFNTLIVYCSYICKEKVWEYIKHKSIYNICIFKHVDFVYIYCANLLWVTH